MFCLGFLGRGSVFTFFFFFFFTGGALRCFHPLVQPTDHPQPRRSPRRGPATAPSAASPRQRLQPAGTTPRLGPPEVGTRPQLPPEKQTNKQTRRRFQICLPKTNEQSRPSARWHWRGRQGRLAGRGGGGPGTALPSPSPPGEPQTTLGSKFSRMRCSARLGFAGPRAAVLKGAGGWGGG